MKKLFTLLWLTIAAFCFKATAQNTSCNADFSFQFLTSSNVKFTPVLVDSPAVQHSWTYGDGSPVDHTVSPTHNYAATGTYTVVHTVVRINPNGTPLCTQSVTKQLVVEPPCNLVVDYSYAASPTNTLSIQFTNLSVPLAPNDSIQWIFGDNSTVYNVVNPSHTYANAGTYTVCLIVKKAPGATAAPCVKYICKSVVVTANPPCNLVVDYSWHVSTTTPVSPLKIEFVNLSTPLAATDSITWTFGDGTSSHDVNPTHTYANYGTYNVCLLVKKNNPAGAPPCIKYTCKTVTVTNPCNLVVDYSWHVSTTVPVNPLRIEFLNLSTPLAATDSITWTFGDGTSSHDVNPTHTYANGGSYTVCLTVKKNDTPAGASPCIRYTCKTITVTAPCTLVVDFSATPSPTNPLSVQFTNLSTPSSPTDSTTWNFGDGSPVSYAANPIHTYTSAGTYNVCLIVKKNDNPPGTTPCVRYICKSITVTNPCNLVVDFSSAAAPTNPLMIQFTNLSTPLSPADSTIWSFGDGSSSYAVNPLHTYANAGTYNVCLIVKKNNNGATPCVRYICKTIVVQAPCTLQANFTWRADSINAQKIWFTNTSTPLSNTDSVRWTFGDGTSSNLVSPDHTYAQPGTYTVCLRVQKRGPAGTVINCVSETCKTIVVYPTCTLQANFTWRADSANAQKIWFTNTSTPITAADSIRWTFGDGTSSNLMNPDHTYAQPGTYTVCLRVQKRYPNSGTYYCVSETCKTIVVYPTCNFQAAWSWQLDSVNVKKVYFTNLTVVPVTNATVNWFFGDGTSATTWNAVHEYANPGRYYVCLRVQISPNCVRYKCDSITVPVPPPPCNNQSNFSFLRASTNSQTYSFVPDFQSAAAVYTWTFGDGTGSHDMIATHHYAQAGTYTACLTVWRSSTCTSTTCKVVTVTAQVNCDSVHVSYSYQRDPAIPNKIYFYASSNFPILDQTWTITRLPAGNTNPPVILHQNNPVYVFTDTGYYNVCLRAVTLGGCVKEYCMVIHIEQIPIACVLQAYPNPATTSVSVNVPLTQPDLINVYVYNNLNVLVKQKQQQGVVGNNVVTLSIGDLVAGYYTMKVVYGTHNCNSAFQKL